MQTIPVTIKETGRIKAIKGCIVKISGLHNCMIGQLITFSDNTRGFVMGFNKEFVLALLLGPSYRLRAGDNVYSETDRFEIPVGDNFLGRIVNSLCEPLDGKGAVDEGRGTRDEGRPSSIVHHPSYYPIFRDAPTVLDRAPIEEALHTGIRIIDSSIPIGKGQRELIIGDRMTGKTTIAVDTILNQKGKDVVSIYCCIGRDYASFEKVMGIFKEYAVLDSVIVVAALASSPLGEKYLAPYAAATLGEHFMYNGRDVLVVFDDLTKHAWAYRELSLLLERSPGREAYPGDIFYLHAQLMERAGRLAPEMGGGSMTFLPIADTLQGDIAGFIPTNLISMTDGQVYLNSTLFGEGFKPAIDMGLSVSRIGSRVQSTIMREVARDVGLDHIRYRELLRVTKLRAAISEELSSRLKHGEKVEQILIQAKNRPSPAVEQILLFYALKEKVLDVLSDEKCKDFKQNIYDYAVENFPDLVKKLETGEALAAGDRKSLNSCIVTFFKKG